MAERRGTTCREGERKRKRDRQKNREREKLILGVEGRRVLRKEKGTGTLEKGAWHRRRERKETLKRKGGNCGVVKEVREVESYGGRK